MKDKSLLKINSFLLLAKGNLRELTTEMHSMKCFKLLQYFLLWSVFSFAQTPIAITGPSVAQPGQAVVYSHNSGSCFGNWSVTNGTIINGQTTGQSITVKFNSGSTGSVIANEAYHGGSPCAAKGTKSVNLLQLGSISTSISGPDYVPCNSVTPIAFSVPIVKYATDYTWTYPSNWQVIGLSNSNQIVLIPDLSTLGNISVKANAFGYSTSTVIKNLKRADVSMLGSNTICNTPEIFTSSTSNDITSYQWSTTGGISIIGSGILSNVTVQRNSDLPGTLSLTVTNACGNASVSKNFDASIGSFVRTITSTKCSKTYKFTPSEGVSLQTSTNNSSWATLALGASLTKTLMYGDTENFYIRTIGSCGISTSSTQQLNGPPLANPPCALRKVSETNNLVENIITTELKIAENPIDNLLNAFYNCLENEEGMIQILDINSKIIFKETKKFTEGQNEININASEFKEGIYIFNVLTDKNQISKKFIVKRK